MQQTVEKPAVRAGWNEQEETLLWAQVTQIRRAGLPLRSAFENMARLTGRKPNSIRNYYYARVKEGAFVPEKTRSAFVPFTKEETQAMLETVLSGQACGRSVRGITLEMGGGDKRAMLRYQNKYRSVLKNTPQEVYAALERLRAEGARQVLIVDEAVAAIIGAGIDISKPEGNLVVDIGGGSAAGEQSRPQAGQHKQNGTGQGDPAIKNRAA